MFLAKFEINCPSKLSFGMRNVYYMYIQCVQMTCNVERVVGSRYKYIMTVFGDSNVGLSLTSDCVIESITYRMKMNVCDKKKNFTISTLFFDTNYEARELTYSQLGNRLRYALNKYGDIRLKMNIDGITSIKPSNIRCISALKSNNEVFLGIVPCVPNECYCATISSILTQIDAMSCTEDKVALCRLTGGKTSLNGVAFVEDSDKDYLILLNNFSGKIPVVWNDFELI